MSREGNAAPLLSETLAVSSVQDFLTDDERAEIIEMLDELIQGIERRDLDPRTRVSSIHSVDGVSVEKVKAAYEPQGRIEIDALPAELQLLLDGAFARSLPALRRSFPSPSGSSGWTYVEYGAGQHITPHADYLGPVAERHESDGTAGAAELCDQLLRLSVTTAQVASMSIPLNDDYEGGEFFVETCSADELWRSDHPALLAGGVHPLSELLDDVPRTRWRTRPNPGTALVYGSQLVHGTEPVTAGRVRKLIGLLHSPVGRPAG